MHIPKYSQMVSPLYLVTCKKNYFHWGPEQQQAFTQIKQEITHAVALGPVRTGPEVMEHLNLEAISTYTEKKVIRSSQHGFTKGKSCLTRLIDFYDETTTWMDEGRAVDIVYLDFSKAFDTVSQHPHRQTLEV
ncbi:hypothetical protein TURU_090066 [Turdus rufiventris]|nr:hypothetical protein TURU_090066 [Turdus rufiventris]